MLYEKGQGGQVDLEGKMGYELEIDCFLRCIRTSQKQSFVTLADGMNAVKTVEAEAESVTTGRTVRI